jgi:hypothetical protein
MVELTWRDIAALWGAGLSTLIVLTRLLPTRPLFFLEPRPRDDSTTDAIIRIINPEKSMRLVRECYRWRLTGNGTVIGVFTRKSRLCDAGVAGTLLLAVKGESETTVKINCFKERDHKGTSRWLLCFTWRGAWLFPIGIPHFVYLSTKRIEQLNAALPDDSEQPARF